MKKTTLKNSAIINLSSKKTTQIWQTRHQQSKPENSEVNSPLYGDFNLGLHVQDKPQNVHHNRMNLLTIIQAEYPHIQQIHWLNQVHGNRVVDIDNLNITTEMIAADAHVTTNKTLALAIMTADCVPIMVSDETGEIIAGIHAGWQGLAKGVIANTINTMRQKSDHKPINFANWQAWVGACINREHYEVDEKVKTQVLAQLEKQLLAKNKQLLSERQKQQFFTAQPNKIGHYLADLSAIAQFQLILCGLNNENIHLSGLDSYADTRFYSYRQQTEQGLPFTGRMATLIFKGQ